MNKKRLIKKIISWSGLFFFALAVFMIYKQLAKYSLNDITSAINAVPNISIIYACIASFLGYLALSSYDYLALKYIKRKLAIWKWIFVGFIGFAISNNAGHAIVSGGAIRYRMYTRWRVNSTDILRMVMFSGFTYLVACFFLVILGIFLSPQHVISGFSSPLITNIILALSIAGIVFYVWVSTYYKKTIIIKDISFHAPGFKLAIEQILIGSIDILMASLVLYSILINYIDIPFLAFIGVYIIAQLLGVYSQVPGGLGVFEIVFAKLLPEGQDQAVLFAILILYRIIYYLLPLIISGIALISYEFLRKKINIR